LKLIEADEEGSSGGGGDDDDEKCMWFYRFSMK